MIELLNIEQYLQESRTQGVKICATPPSSTAGNNYSAYAPDLPGCIATGNIVEEAKQEIRKAIEFHIDGLCEDGLPVPAPASVVEYL